MELHYHLLDVFTDEPFGGNQLAVFADAPSDLPTDLMQRIARELNLSETTFVTPPADPAHDFRVRIFTPAAELPMAGHPTIGTAWILRQLGRVGAKRRLVFEEGIGPVETLLDEIDGAPGPIWMRQMPPRFMAVIDDRQAIAEMLSLDAADLHPAAPVQALSSGLPFLFVALQTLDAIGRARLRADLWSRLLADADAKQVFLTTLETQYAGATAHSRMFAPALGINEDPATGSASGPLAAYLLRYGLIDGDEMISEQGIEMGRPSFIRVRVEREAGEIRGLLVGGSCVYMGHGALNISQATAS